MTTLSGCTLVRNAVKLNYPLEASILTYYPICDEVVIAYDPTSEDDTEGFVKDLVRRYPKLRAIPSPWDMNNHVEGTEITIQSNVAFEACSSDWVLYVQADEAIHESDHAAIRRGLDRKDLNGVVFDRRSFLGSLDREIPEFFARGLVRIVRNGQGLVVGDGMTLGYVQGVKPAISPAPLRMYNYSRMGSREEILLRSRNRDHFHIATPEGIEKNQETEFRQGVAPFNAADHPAPIRRFYEHDPNPTARPRVSSFRSPVTLALLMGPGEREHLAPFFWQFRHWPGDVVVLDDLTSDGASEVLGHQLRDIFRGGDERVRVLRTPLGGDFAKARNLLHDAARAPWVLTTAPDERWDENLLRNMPDLIRQLEQDGKLICGFPRANFVDGVLVNDVPDSQWTDTGLLAALGRKSWPPRNPDVQYRLLRKEERWQGKIHEHPSHLFTRPDAVVVLSDYWILHSKTLSRQRKQDTFYKSLGQLRGMPPLQSGASEPQENLREATLREVINRFPEGPLTIVETGTLRDSSPAARASDRWSTYCFAECLAKRGVSGSKLYSIDIAPEAIAISKKTVPDSLHPWVTWITSEGSEAIKRLDVDSIDFLYLDSCDDSVKILSEFEAALPKLKEESIVVIDDTGPGYGRPEGKGTMTFPVARKKGWSIERRDTDACHMAILTREKA